MFVSIFFRDNTSKHYADVTVFQLKKMDTDVSDYVGATHVRIVGSAISNKRDSKILPVSHTFELRSVSCITSRNEKSSTIVLNSQGTNLLEGDL